MQALRCWILLLGFVLSPQLWAQSQNTPLDRAPDGPYTDEDSAARQPTMQELGLGGHVDLGPLRERADRKMRDWRLQALVGQMEHLARNRDAAETRYQRAVDAAGDDPKKLRHVLWSRGWGRLYSGDNDGALADWRDAARLHGGKPEWLPHTLAVGYWRRGDRSVGMQWFEASELARSDAGKHGPKLAGLPQIARSLLGDIFDVRELRSNPSVQRISGGKPANEPAYLFAPPPRYPRAGITGGMQGNTLLQACVDARGKPQHVEIEKSSGRPLLDAAAKRAVADWQFRPATCDGAPRASAVLIPILFRLSSKGAVRVPPPPASFFSNRFDPEVSLDPDGYTAVRRECGPDPGCGDGSARPTSAAH